MASNPSFWGRRAVARTQDFLRIKDLPVRGPIDGPALALEMTAALKTPRGTMQLKPVQALALYELLQTGGLCAPMSVGSGKTLVFLLAPVVLGLNRAIGLIPASLVEKTERERANVYAEHWRIDRCMQLISYEMLGRVSAATLLETKMPDGIIADEAHKLRNEKAACTRRVSRWLREHPETKFVSMSGTILGKSLHDMAHLVRWSLGANNAPVPIQEGELREWADALDERVNPLQRVRPGALLELEDLGREANDTDDELAIARKAFNKRFSSTPGIVSSLNNEDVNCSLYIKGQTYDVNETTEDNFQKLRTEWETPDGWALSEAVDVWRHARELAIGMHYIWEPRPPEEWLAARRAWAKFVREILSESRTLDSEKQVALACERGDLPGDEYNAWLSIKDTFTINQKAVWHDDSVLNLCADWLKKEKGICWVEHTFFGRELSKRTGFPYFGQNGLDADGRSILDAAGPIIASVAANGTGKNLQHWHKNLVVSCPTGATVWEQLIGRTHRQGQTADAVEVTVLMGCSEHASAWERAVSEARMNEDMIGEKQKLLMCDVDMPEGGSGRTEMRWAKKAANTFRVAT